MIPVLAALRKTPSILRLGGYDFTFIETLSPQRDASGTILEFSPQAAYAKAATVPLHRYGHGTFCRFRISAPKGLTGVYALVAEGAVDYIGECDDLARRFNMGYGTISPRNCYDKGQPTNCKLNRWVLEVAKAGGRVQTSPYELPRRFAVGLSRP